MFSLPLVLIVIIGYVLSLYFLARYVETHYKKLRKIVLNPYIYSLSLAVYCTSWTYYGSVGSASRSGLLFITIYLGPTVMMILSPTILKKMILINKEFRLTSLVDLISIRYGKDSRMGYLVSGSILLGTLPYVAVQLKSIFKTISLLTSSDSVSFFVEVFILAILIFFTITIGIRKQDPTERHPGMIFTLAIECFLKFIAFVSVGIFTVYFLNDGAFDVMDKIDTISRREGHHFFGVTDLGDLVTYAFYMVIASIAFILLPRQYHVAVVENPDSRFLNKARWLFPLYVFVITLFVLPVAYTGLEQGLDPRTADSFVLQLPMLAGENLLSLFTFIGGFSASFGMILISTMALSTIVTNHIVLPLAKSRRVSKNGLLVKWITASTLIVISYLYLKTLGQRLNLISLGMIAFVAVLQLAPATFGGIYWRYGSKRGAFLSIALGYLVWAYTLLLPEFIHAGFFPKSILSQGPFGVFLLRPQALLGIDGFNPYVHTTFFSMLANISGYLFGSIFCPNTSVNHSIAESIVDIDKLNKTKVNEADEISYILGRNIPLKPKEIIMEDILRTYFPDTSVKDAMRLIKEDVNLSGAKNVSTTELVRFIDKFEYYILGSLGLVMAQKIIQDSGLLSSEERRLAMMEASELLAKSREELEEQKSKTLIASRLSALGEMAGGIAHEINNPITVIKVLAQLMKKRLGKNKADADFLNESVEDILLTTNKIEKIIEGMKNISNDKADDNYIETDLKSVLNDCLSISKTKLEVKNIKLDIDISSKIFQTKVFCNHTKLAQVFINLINNSAHAISQLKIKEISIDAEVVLDKVILKFSDSGKGIPLDIQNKMFQPFYTSKQLGEGTGLGLSLSRQFVREHGGDLYYDANSVNTCFIIEIPLSQKQRLD